MAGLKYNKGKSRMSLLSQRYLRAMGDVLRFGEDKYTVGDARGTNNWRKGINVSDSIDAAMRHLGLAAEGEDIDPEAREFYKTKGFTDAELDRLGTIFHLASVAINCMFAWETIQDRPEFDDRFKIAQATGAQSPKDKP